MSRIKILPTDCFLCGELIGGFVKSTSEISGFSATPIRNLLATFIAAESLDQQNYVCQNCFIKINELDEHQSLADRIKIDLLNGFNAIRQNPHDVKVKIEAIDVVELVDSDNEEQDVDDWTQDDDPDYKNDDEDAKDDDPDFKDDDSDFKVQKIEPKKPTRKRIRKPTVRNPEIESMRKKLNLPANWKPPEPIVGATAFIEDKKNMFKCDTCGRVAKRRAQMVHHVGIHTTERNVCCQECGAFFKTMSCLYSHQKIHRERRKLICDICGKAYDQKYYIMEHMNAKHLNNRVHSCTVCGVTFARKASLLKHGDTHRSNAERKFVCEVCGFRSHTKPDMQRHLKTHTGEKNHACSICDRRFACRYNVLAHIKTVHEGIKPKIDESKVKCIICARIFPRQKQLRKHYFVGHQMAEYAAEFTGQ